MDPLAVSPKEACTVLGCGLTTLYQLMGSDELESFKIGRATRITTDSLRAYVTRQIEEARTNPGHLQREGKTTQTT